MLEMNELKTMFESIAASDTATPTESKSKKRTDPEKKLHQAFITRFAHYANSGLDYDKFYYRRPRTPVDDPFNSRLFDHAHTATILIVLKLYLKQC